MAEDTATTEAVKPAKAAKGKTLQADFDLFDNGVWYKNGHVFEGEIPAFIQAQVHFGAAELV